MESDLIPFQKKDDEKAELGAGYMMPADWVDRYNPSLNELTTTIKTVNDLLEDHREALCDCKPSASKGIRDNIGRLEYLQGMLMDYYYDS